MQGCHKWLFSARPRHKVISEADYPLCAQAAVYPKVHDLTYPLPEVDIRVHCLYGTGKDTDEGYVYDVPKFNASGPPPPKKVVKGPGDGTVNLRSLEACKG